MDTVRLGVSAACVWAAVTKIVESYPAAPPIWVAAALCAVVALQELEWPLSGKTVANYIAAIGVLFVAALGGNTLDIWNAKNAPTAEAHSRNSWISVAEAQDAPPTPAPSPKPWLP